MAKKSGRRRRRPSKSAPRRRRRARRRRNPDDAGAPPREYNRGGRRRASRRRRRRNPGAIRRYGGSALGLGSIGSDFRDAIPRFLGKLWVAWAVRRWGAQFGTGGMFGQAHVSPTAGESWTFGQYALGYIAANFGARMFARMLHIDAAKFRQGGLDLVFTKLFWTEGIARSQWAQTQFGTPHYGHQMLGQAEGDVREGPNGQLWMMQNGQWIALQGAHGGQLVTASKLDGQLVAASRLDGVGSYGHALPQDTPSDFATMAAYSRTGSANPYVQSRLAGAM